MTLNPEYKRNQDIPKANLLAGKVAVVTGASRGIGRATAEALAYWGAGAVVISSTENSQSEAEETQEVIKSYGAETLWVSGRLEEKDAGQRLIKETIGRFKRLHILVNNAGINKDGPFIRLKSEDFDNVIRVNFESARSVTRAAMNYLLMQPDKASVIFMSSVATHGNPGQANYAAAKGAIEALMKTLAVEYGGMGLRSNAIAPSLVNTQMADRLPPEQREALIKMTPLGRLVTTSEVAEIAVFLASDMSRVVNGQVINADGGMLR